MKLTFSDVLGGYGKLKAAIQRIIVLNTGPKYTYVCVPWLVLLGVEADLCQFLKVCKTQPISKMSSAMKLILSPAARNKIKNTRLGQSLTGVNLT
jgi:hypothetical protein